MRTRRIVVFVGSFILSLILAYIFFVGIFSRLPQDKVSSLFNNAIFSFTLFAAFFLVIPALFAYWVTFEWKKLDQVDTGKSFSPVKFSLLATLILTVIFLGLFSLVMQPKFEPYAFREIAPGELTTPAPYQQRVVAERIIDGVKYQLVKEEDISDSVSLYRIDDKTEHVESVYVNLPIFFRHEGNNNAFWYDQTSKTTFVINRSGFGKSEYEETTSYTIKKSGAINKKLLLFKGVGFYAGSSILKYYPSHRELLMVTSGGDGCGGGGKVWFLSTSGSQTTVQEFESGCANTGKNPDYIGFSGKLLVFGNYTDPDKFETTGIRELIVFDPISDEKIIITPEEGLSAYLRVDEQGSSGNKIVLVKQTSAEGEKRYQIDLATKKIVPL